MPHRTKKYEVGILAVDGSAVTFATAMMADWDWAGLSQPRPLLAVPNVTCTDQRPVYQSLYCCIMVRCSAVLMCP